LASPPIIATPFRQAEDAALGSPIRVHVVDVDGRPVDGERVVLFRKLGREGWVLTSSLTDSGGVAEIRVDRDALRSDQRSAAWFVTVDIPLLEQPVAPVDLSAPPELPVELAIGPTGRALIRIFDAQKNPIVEPSSVSLRTVLDDGTSFSVTDEREARIVRGEARFERVGVGTKLTAKAGAVGRRNQSKASADGPQRAGDEVVLDVTIDVSHPFVTGTVLDSDRQPLTERRLHGVVEATRDARRSTLAIDTDAAGRFRVEIVEPFAAGEQRRMDVSLEGPSGQLVQSASVDLSRPLAAGDTDVGDVLLTPAPLIASGMVVDDDNRPVHGANLKVERKSEPEAAERRSSPPGSGLPNTALRRPTTLGGSRFAESRPRS
jgi:hypothetical protein